MQVPFMLYQLQNFEMQVLGLRERLVLSEGILVLIP